MPEPAVLASLGTIAVIGLGGLLYIIRAEIGKNTKVTKANAEQMVPNHGTSMRDAVDRIEKRQEEDRSTYARLINEVHNDVVYVRDRIDRHVETHDHKNPTGLRRRRSDVEE